jgi:hypothetical protein
VGVIQLPGHLGQTEPLKHSFSGLTPRVRVKNLKTSERSGISCSRFLDSKKEIYRIFNLPLLALYRLKAPVRTTFQLF